MKNILNIQKNMGNADRLIRMLAGVAMLSSAHLIGSTVGSILLYVIGTIFVTTAVLAYCPLYTIVGFSSCASNESATRDKH